MKNLKTKIVILASLISTVGVFGTSLAAGLSLSATPASATKNTAESFNISVDVKTDGSSVYAVEGTLIFNNLTCKSITVSNDLVIQSAPAPTCSNPYFLIGIKKGTNVDKTLFKVLVTGNSAGSASISFKDADIIGAGKSLSNTSVGGVYQITEVPKPLILVATTTTATSSVATSSQTSTSSEVTPSITINTEDKNNGFVASVLGGLYNLPNMLFTLTPLSIIVLLLLGFIFYKIPRDGIVE
jgi:hypothetical protein